MYRRDYIMRQIEFMVEVMQQLSGLAAEKRHQAAMALPTQRAPKAWYSSGVTPVGQVMSWASWP